MPTTHAAISANVAYGLVSGAMPAISSARSRGSFFGRLRRFRSGSPERSIFGARFRTRCPQYVHSVTVRQVHQLRAQPVASRHPLVLVEHLVWVARERLARVVVL